MCYHTLGLYWDNGKENGNYRDYIGLYRDYREHIGCIFQAFPASVYSRCSLARVSASFFLSSTSRLK